MTLTDQDVERVALRVVEFLEGSPTGDRLIDAATAADRLGVSRATVYELADELGAKRIGSGSRPRLRFDPERVAAYGARVEEATPIPFRPRRRSAATSPAPLLRIKEAA